MDEAMMWQAVTTRATQFDGEFVFAVRTTGVYCRPSCPARRPNRNNVSFFNQAAQAEAAGFRPCRRCHPDQATPPEPNLALMEAVCRAIVYSITPCPLGWLLVAATPRGLCAVRLGDSEAELAATLAGEFPAAQVARAGDLDPWVASIQDYLHGSQPHLDLPLDVRATAFQSRVWQALRAIPYGSTRSYGEVAQAIGQPSATRAVGHACATNPVALVIPCHRVVREDGGLGGYRWGIERKRALLAQEASLHDLPLFASDR